MIFFMLFYLLCILLFLLKKIVVCFRSVVEGCRSVVVDEKNVGGFIKRNDI